MALAEAHPDMALGFQDEVWWSRVSHPCLHAWTDGQPMRLVEQSVPKGDDGGKAIAAYGLYLPCSNEMLLRFVQGRPVSTITCAFLGWLANHFSGKGKKALCLIWDNASWHISRIVGDWIKLHNQNVKEHGGCRLIVCRLPSRSPWLNPIEPKWIHGKRAVAESNRLLSMNEIMQRICDYYQCELVAPLSQPDC